MDNLNKSNLNFIKDFSGYVNNNVKKENHVIAANEGNAVAMVAGHYLATGKTSMVYLQNSDLGNIISPLLSLRIHEPIFTVKFILHPQHWAFKGDATLFDWNYLK